jgi:hypothetical protein
MIKPDFKIDRLLFYLLLDFIFRVYIKDNATIHCLYTNWKALFFVLSKLFFKKNETTDHSHRDVDEVS